MTALLEAVDVTKRYGDVSSEGGFAPLPTLPQDGGGKAAARTQP